MRNYLVISHGRLADGIVDTLKLFLGEHHKVKSISAFVYENQDIDQEIRDFFAGISPDDDTIVFSDIFGGSVHQKVMAYIDLPNTYLIAGVNLPTVLQFALLSEDDPLTEELIQETVDKLKESIVFTRNTDADQDFDE